MVCFIDQGRSGITNARRSGLNADRNDLFLIVFIGFATMSLAFGLLGEIFGYLVVNVTSNNSAAFWTMIWTGILAVASLTSVVLVVVGTAVAYQQLSQARRDQRVKYTNELISQRDSPEGKHAQVVIVPKGMTVTETHNRFTEKVQVFFNRGFDIQGEGVDREYMEAVFFHTNLLQRTAVFHERGLLDFNLWAAFEAINCIFLCTIMSSPHFADLTDATTPGSVGWLARQAYRYSMGKNPDMVFPAVREAFGDPA